MNAPEPKAVQDYYPDDFAHCFGCGRLNADGLHVRSVWDGEETVARFTPRADHMAVPASFTADLLELRARVTLATERKSVVAVGHAAARGSS